MSPLWRPESRVGLCPDRLVTAQAVHPVSDDGIAQISELANRNRLGVVLSNHLVRYAVLPWKEALVSERDWHAYARHAFESTYGSVAADWRIRTCPTGARAPRVACAVDASLIESLRAIKGVASIQPYLVAAFNLRRRAFSAPHAWFVLHEPGRLMLALIAQGTWQRIRVRQAGPDWRSTLADLLERELVDATEDALDVAFASTEDELPSRVGRFRIVDLSLPRGTASATRSQLMALH